MGEQVRTGLRTVLDASGVDGQVTGENLLFRIHPHRPPVAAYRDARHDEDEAAVVSLLQRRLLSSGVHLSS